MKVSELIKALEELPPDHEIAVFAASGVPRPPVLVKANAEAFKGGNGRHVGFENARKAFLLRPEDDVI